MGESRIPTVSDLGELELLARIRARMREPTPNETWAGDDTAILGWSDDKILLTTDMIVEGIDFDLSYASGEDVGWKALAINASDIASMGGRPAHAVAAVGLRPETSVAFVDDFVDGLLAACDAYGVALVGGDVSAASEITATVAMVGAAIGRPLERSGAAAGDAICVTGSLGGAAAGLVALRRRMGDDVPAVARLKRRHLRPPARVAEAAALVSLAPTAMIDVSDGLAVDLGNLIQASDVGCEVDAGAVPIDPDIRALGDVDPLEIAVLGGEDFELLFTIDPRRTEDAAAALRATGTPVVRIGTVVESGGRLGDRSLEDWRSRGWQHLRSR
jgi:thiamine-monophosphate kinase